MQKAWYIFSQEQKIYIAAQQKDYTSKASIKSFETATNKVLEKVDKEFLSIFPAELKTIFYSSKNSKEAPTLDVETEFKQLATLGQTIKSKMVEIGKTTLTSTNVVVAELLFVVSSEPYEKGKTHDKTFIKVPIMFDSDTKLLSRDTTDGVVKSDSGYKKQIKSDHAAAKKLKLPVKSEVKDGTLKQLFYHSERVLLAALRDEAIVTKIVDDLVSKIAELRAYMELCKVYGAALILYSTNSVCDNCVYSLITNQNKVHNLNTVQSIFHKLLTEHENLTLSAKHEFKIITLVRSDKPFSIQAQILHNENVSFGNPKAKIYLEDDTIDLHKIFKLPNSSNILIESIEKGAMEDAMPEEKPMAFMSGSKASKFSTETKITNLEESINSLYNDESTSSDEVEGRGVFVHDSSSYWHMYTKVAMDNLLQLRLKVVNLEDSVETFSPNYVFDGSNNIATKLARDISTKVNNGTLLVKLNLYNKHWVGIALDRNTDEINIQYMDPEQQEMPPLLKGKLAEALAIAHPECQVDITEAEVELQRYNNCGLEVIENFMQHVTGHRLSQEDALPVHALLFGDAIMLTGDINMVYV
jgi:hypothetical protein